MQPTLTGEPQGFFIEFIAQDKSFEVSSLHTHRQFEICYQVAGARRYVIEGATYIVNAGDVVLIGEGQLHRSGAFGEQPSSRIVLNFGAGWLRPVTAAFPELDLFSFLGQEQNHLLRALTARQQSGVYALLRRMLAVSAQDAESQALRRLLLAALLLELRALCRAQPAAGAGVRSRTAEQVQAYVAEHYAEKLSLAGIAARFYLSPCHLSRLFKRATGIGLTDYINGVRVKAAQHRLAATGESAAAVGAGVGFGTTAHFRRVFRQITGVTPQQYRQLCRGACGADPKE